MAKYMKVTNHGSGNIDLRYLGENACKGIPVEFHFKENGDVEDKPSIVIVMRTGMFKIIPVFGEMSLNTLQECLNEVGYDIIKK